MLHSSFVANGKVVRMKSARGHEIELDVVMGKASIEDLLKLGVKTDPPIMTGAIATRTKLSLLASAADVANRLTGCGKTRSPFSRSAPLISETFPATLHGSRLGIAGSSDRRFLCRWLFCCP